MQTREQNGDGESAVAIPNERRSMLLCLYLFVFCILTLGTVQHIYNEEKLT